MVSISLDESEKAIIQHLTADVHSATWLMTEHNYHQFLRRTFMRAFFAFAEGWGEVLRRSLLRLPEAKRLGADKQCILRDEKYEVQKNGKTEVREARYPFLNHFAATLRFWGEVQEWDDHRITNSIFGNDNWGKFQDALQVRHRLTHPKPGSDMEVSTSELENATAAFYWLLSIQAELLSITIDHATIDRMAKLQIEKP